MKTKLYLLRRIIFLLIFLSTINRSFSQSVTIDASASGRQQIIDGFGTCLSGSDGEKPWFQNLYYDDAGCSILRMDLVPRFIAPFSDNTYNSPWFHNNPSLPGPDGNNVRTYTDASDYTRLFNGNRAQIAIMEQDITKNILKFDFTQAGPKAAIAMAKLGQLKKNQLGDFKFTASIWSPAPWLKIPSGNTYEGSAWPLPVAGVKFPFIWADNFVGGKLDVSNTPRPEFFDGVQNTSALTQFARSTAAYVKGIQDRAGVKFYAISIQNELNFETFYNSCTYPLSSQYIIAVKAIRQEFDKYPDLKDIKIMGPEDLLGGDAYGMWQYGNANGPIHKNLQYLTEIAKDPAAQAAVDFYCIHGYAPDGVSSAGSNSTLWDWWTNGWGASPAPGIPSNVKGFRAYNKKSWMTETSGENPAWIYPTSGFPNDGGFSIALKIHQALTNGYESAWVYWQFSDGSNVAASTLTDATQLGASPKYNAFKHYSKYIRPNAVRLATSVSGSTSLTVSSYIHDVNKSLTVVLVNSNSAAQTVIVNVPALPFSLSSFDSYTSSNNNYWKSAPLAISANKVTITVPGYGVSTLYGVGTTVVNQSPIVALTGPANNATFTAPATIAISANASDADGSISKVEFYNGSTKVGEDLTSPYSFSWTNVAAGTYSLTARATDNSGATASSAAVSVVVSPATSNAVKTYHLGNSLTDTHNGMLAPIALSAGKSYTYLRTTIPGAPTDWIWDHPGQANGEPDYRTVFSTQVLDHIFTQPFAGHCRSIDNEADYSGRFFTEARKNNANVQHWLYMQWPSTSLDDCWSDGRGGVNGTDATNFVNAICNHRIYFEKVRDLMDQQQPGKAIRIMPSGLALAKLKIEMEAGRVPGMTDFNANTFTDGLHLTDKGSYLMSLTHYAGIYGESPVNRVTHKPASMTEQQATIYKQIAWEVVSDYPWTGLGGSGILANAICNGGGNDTITPPPVISNNVEREYWANVSGTTISAIPVNTAPASKNIITSLEGPTDMGDNYATRVRGYIVPSTAGWYTLYISGDDNAELWLSSGSNPADKVRVAHVPGWTTSKEWAKYPEQKSTQVYLVKGGKFYFEILHKEGGGGDNWAVGWTGPGIATPTVITGANLDKYVSDPVNKAPVVSIVSPVNNTSFTAPATIAISVSASDADGTISKVEFFNGSVKLGEDQTSPYSFNWTGVNAGTYSITARATDNAGAIATSSSHDVVVNAATNPDCKKLSGILIGTSGSWNNAGDTKEKALDGNTSSFFDSPAGNGAWVGFDLPSVSKICKVRFFPRSAYEYRMVGGKFQGSNVADFSSATDLYTITVAPAANQWTEASINNSTGFKYVRYLAPNDGFGNISELEFLGGPAVVSNGTGLSATYYDNMDFTGATLNRIDAEVNFNWGTIAPASSIGSDQYSVRWTGSVQPLYSESYTFYTMSDDGVRLWVNGQLLIDNWTNHPATENSGTIALIAGQKYDLKMEYFENAVNAVARLSWSSTSQAKQVIPASQLYPVKGTGLSATYYDNMNFTGISVQRIDTLINFDWAQASPAPGLGPDQFSVRWTGQVEAKYSETYTFYTMSDDGVRLWVNGQLLIDNWTDHAPTENSGTISLVAGQKYDITMEYFENSVGAVAKLLWSSTSQPKEVVAKSNLYPDEESNTVMQLASAENAEELITVHPNPASDYAVVNLTAPVPREATVQITDHLSTVISEKTFTLEAGAHSLKIDVSSCKEGLHYVIVNSGNKTSVKKIMVHK